MIPHHQYCLHYIFSVRSIQTGKCSIFTLCLNVADTVSETTRQAEVRRAEDVSSEPLKRGYLVGDDVWTVWWEVGVLSATVSCASTLQFLPLRPTIQWKWSALPAYVLRSTRHTREEASRTAISESFRNLYRALSHSKAAPSEGRAPYRSFRPSHGDLLTSKCAIQFWMLIAVAVGKWFNLKAPLKPAGGRAVVQAQCIKQQVAGSCFL